jgi:uncharacterized membrane protein YqjE
VAEQDSGNATLSERSVAELLKQLSDQTQTLVRQELELARIELTQKGKQAGIGAGMFGAAGMLGLYALGALTAAIVLVISRAVTGWLAALITAALYGAVAGILALNGKSRVSKGIPPVPEQTVQTVREDIAVVERSAKEGRR